MPSSDSATWERFDEVDALLEKALLRAPEDRRAFLVEACAGDGELLAQLERLISDSEEELTGPGHALARAAFLELDEEPDSGIDLGPGDTVGAYALISELGRGGMATVFAAERADGTFQKRVALKVLHRGLDTTEVVARFRAERQILASLEHPRIAQLIDGGSTIDGRPYLVMELVPGAPIHRFCDDHRLGVDARLRLFLQVAEAVEFAHRHLVIHRDIKPANILVMEDGTPKLLDFGIAKLLQGDQAEPTTRTGMRFLTPEYAAPEQLLGERVSTQSDVYSLCVLLYQLLTGLRPYEDPDRRAALERVVLGEEPTAPSTVVHRVELRVSHDEGVSDGEGEIFARRSTTPQGLRRRLKGDLDAILLRGLRSRPEHRYGSVGELAADLRRYLGGEPVTARGDARIYRARKFARRHRGALAASVAFVTVLAASTVALALQRGTILEERNRAQEAAALASQEAESARQVTAFLVDLFRGNDPRERMGDTITARALLAQGTERVRRELVDEPAIQADLLDAIGAVYGSLGAYERAADIMNEAVAVRRRDLVARDGLGLSLLSLGTIYRDASEWREAEAAYREAVGLLEPTDRRHALGQAKAGLGSAEMFMGNLDSARTHVRQGVELLEVEAGVTDGSLAAALSTLAGLERRAGRLEGADSLHTRSIALALQQPPVDSASLATLLNNAAVVKRELGQVEAAAELYGQALAICVEIYEAAHPSCLNKSANLGHALDQLGRKDEAVDLYRDRVSSTQQRWPEGHWRVPHSQLFLGGGLLRAGRVQESVAPLRAAVSGAIDTMGLYHGWTNVYRGWLGAALTLSDQPREGRDFFDDSLRGLGLYEGLAEDPTMVGMIQQLVEFLEGAGLEDRAAAYRALPS